MERTGVDDTCSEQGGRAAPSGGSDGYLREIFAGSHPTDFRPRCLALEHWDQVIIGRRADDSHELSAGHRQAVLRIDDRWASRVHAVLRREAGRWIISDAGAKNGLRVNRVLVGEYELRDGDLIEVGATVFRFHFGRRLFARESRNTSTDEPAGREWMRTSLRALHERFGTLRCVAPQANVSVLIRGETGTGKELLARAVHTFSNRRGPFVAVNCAALPASLLEAELFGHRRGAFTGASVDRPGLIQAAAGGTLFLDEVGELSQAGQAALLRVLQERVVRAVGDDAGSPVDFRLVAATHRSLTTAEGFRSDLLGRLDGFTITLPALRRRIDDLGFIVQTILTNNGATGVSFAPSAVRALVGYIWPRNIRELENRLIAALAIAGAGTIEAEILNLARDMDDSVAGPPSAPSVRASGTASSALAPELERVSRAAPAARAWRLSDREIRRELDALLAKHGGNVSAVARVMRTTRAQVHRWAKRLEISIESYRRS